MPAAPQQSPGPVRTEGLTWLPGWDTYVPGKGRARERENGMPEIFVAKSAEFKDGDRRIVESERGDIGVFHHDGAYYAYANTCTHSGGPACEGVMIPKVVDVIAEDRTYHGQTFAEDEMHFVCPWHGWEYDLKTGVCVGDRRRKLKKYDVVRRGDDIFVIA
jgi:nitrite reductase/ring-hydroxylating ferredoxin subunit